MTIASEIQQPELIELDDGFDFFDKVRVVGSDRLGDIVAITDHADGRTEYSVRFIQNGFVTRAWFNAIDLEAAPAAEGSANG